MRGVHEVSHFKRYHALGRDDVRGGAAATLLAGVAMRGKEGAKKGGNGKEGEGGGDAGKQFRKNNLWSRFAQKGYVTYYGETQCPYSPHSLVQQLYNPSVSSLSASSSAASTASAASAASAAVLAAEEAVRKWEQEFDHTHAAHLARHVHLRVHACMYPRSSCGRGAGEREVVPFFQCARDPHRSVALVVESTPLG